MYLNKFDFIYGAHGVQAAAKVYFGKDQKDLNLIEAAVLIGMLKNPSFYNPIKYLKNSTERRNVVLYQLYDYGELSNDHYNSLKKIPININNFNKARYDDGPAQHVRMELTKWLKKVLSDNKIRKPDGSEYNIYTDGIKIYTTIDIDYQKYAEQAAFEQMKEMQKRYWRRWKGMDPMTYEADDPYQIEKRKQSIESKIINSDRYQSLKNKILDSILVKINEVFDGLYLNENATLGLIEVKNGKKSLNELISARIIKSKSKVYDLMRHKLWNEYLRQWNRFQAEKNKQFNTSIKMKVFSYNDHMEKDTVMTPMDSVLYHIRHLQTGVLAMESGTGKIKAWVGGIGFNYFKFDHINNRRQVGSL